MSYLEDPLIPILTIFALGSFVALAMLALARFLGPRKFHSKKHMVYECGMDPVGSAKERVSVKYYLVAILFILFDLEAAFLLPLALSWESLSSVGLVALSCLGFFFLFFALGIWYDFQSKALEWER